MSDRTYLPPPPPPPPAESRLEEAVVSAEPKRPLSPTEEPAAKRPRPDGSLAKVNPAIIAAAKDIDEWIAARKKNWPTSQRVREREDAKLAEPAPDAAEGSAPNADADGPHGEGHGPDGTVGNFAGPQTANKPMCRYFLRGKCRAGSACRFSHEKRAQRPAIYKRFEPPVRNSLFVKLMQSDHDSQDLKILQYISELDAAGRLD